MKKGLSVKLSNRYAREIVAVLLVKLVLIVIIKLVWFSGPHDVTDEAVAARLAASPDAPSVERKMHD